ncbi:MAG: immune inhibitor A, partial [Chloroflexi bacterium]|nr:immune inhibitor A [Chloroflexota bacterium]
MAACLGVVRERPVLGAAGHRSETRSHESARVRGATGTRTEVGAALARLVVHSIPERNLYVLADQLRLRPPRRIPHVIRTFSPNYPVGHQDTFWVLGEDKNRYFRMAATIRAETPHLYVYVQNGVTFPQAGLDKAANTFERSIYPTDRSYFGSEWTPGVDGDPHITCLIGDLQSSGVAGYYSAEDEYPRLVDSYSNQREMFLIDSNGATPGSAIFDSTLAHEFQHMIHWHMHPHENLWLNEGMSMMAERFNGYAPVDEADAFVAQPTTQLNTWNETASSSIAHYGASYLFLSYLYDRYGRGLVRDILADKRYTDFELINDVLQRRHIDTTADRLFTQWVSANYVNDRSFANGVYGYNELPRQVEVQRNATVPFTYQGSVPPYAAQYVVLDGLSGKSPFRLRFSAPVTVPAVGAGNGTPFWWSDRGDMDDSRLTRAVDLTRVHRATLHFQTWYDIEQDYDYAYVEASLDGGKTWDTLRGTHTTTSNPNGASYGNAYTGTSKGWLTESVDLSRYAGRRILLRLEYITDEGYNGQSWVVKNLSIPQIGWRDTFTGWTAQGFVPITTNALPSTWTVQLISYTARGIEVTRLPVSGGNGSLSIDPAKEG